MAFERGRTAAQARTGTQVDIDQGLRAYMLKIYNYMALALVITGLVAFSLAQSESAMQTLFGTSLRWVVILAPLAFILVLSFGINRLSAPAAQVLFWLFAVAMGASMSTIFMVYTDSSIARVFFITAAAFGGLSLYGYTTKKDLSGFGSFLIMGLIGLIIASVVNLFLASSALMFAISVIGVLIFAGLTAYDTQKLKLMYVEGEGAVAAEKKSIMGALTLYLDFVLMFQYLLMLFGNRE